MASISGKHDLNRYTKAVIRLIRSGVRANLKRVISKAHPSDLAIVLEHISQNERREFLPLVLEGRKLGATLMEIKGGLRHSIIHDLENSMLARMVATLSSDDAADLLESLPQDRIEAILSQVRSLGVRHQLRKLLSFKPSTAGSIMQAEFVALHEEDTVRNAMDIVRRQYQERPIFYLYILDSDDRLAGVISLRHLLFADENTPLGQIARRNLVKVTVDEDQEKVAQLAYRYDLLALPVVDAKNRLVGMITVDDVMDVMEEEVSDDIYKLAGSNMEEMLYEDKIFKIAKIRLPWLFVSVFTGSITAIIIGLFNATIEQIIALASFIPVITGMSGNVGTQSAAITVRGLALGRITIASLSRTVFREMRVGGTLGLVTGLVVAVIGSLIVQNLYLGIVIALSMLLGISFAATTSTLMPILFARLNIDPAVASGPLVTTLNDCISVVIYLSLATTMTHFLL